MTGFAYFVGLSAITEAEKSKVINKLDVTIVIEHRREKNKIFIPIN